MLLSALRRSAFASSYCCIICGVLSRWVLIYGAALLIVATYVTISSSSPKSAIYYKGDSRVKKWALGCLFLLAGILGAPILIVVLSKVLFLRSCPYRTLDLVEEEVDIFQILFRLS